MNYVAGIDVGSLCTKVVILNSVGNVVAHSIIRSGSVYKNAAEKAMKKAMEKAGLKQEEVSYVLATGYGRRRVSFANSEVTEITCHARGINHVFPETRVLIDIGGQDSKVIQINEKGQAVNFVMNDKCAAGTGRFLEIMAATLEVDFVEMSRLAEASRNSIEISSVCTVFAESEVISLFSEGVDKADIAASIFRSAARRITGLVGQIGKKGKFAMSGGVAKIKGMVRALEEYLNTTLLIPDEPQIIGALGAALIAREKLNGIERSNGELV